VAEKEQQASLIQGASMAAAHSAVIRGVAVSTNKSTRVDSMHALRQRGNLHSDLDAKSSKDIPRLSICASLKFFLLKKSCKAHSADHSRALQSRLHMKSARSAMHHAMDAHVEMAKAMKCSRGKLTGIHARFRARLTA
jgi:hypothetical protein